MPDLFDHAAERAAIASGRPLSQERLAIRGLDAAPAGPLFAPPGLSCICGASLPSAAAPCPAACGR